MFPCTKNSRFIAIFSRCEELQDERNVGGKMFHFGFSYVGVLYLLMLFVPNIIWTKHLPEGYEDSAKKENKILFTFERIGEALTCVIVLAFSDFNPRKTMWVIWLVISFAFMLLYEIYWIRYFKSEHTMKDMYSSLFGIPVAGATLPIIAFVFLGIYGSNVFLLLSVIILGIGHIGIHLQHKNEVYEKKEKKLITRILKWISLALISLVLILFIFVIGYRNVNYFQHYKLVKSGIDEAQYLMLGGQEQYILMRGENINNPVIIYLHGGPSSPDGYVTYGFTDYLTDDYTVIAWDQRGCGRTYMHNRYVDVNNNTASFEQALADLDELVDYARERFHQDKVIILGHSYGTILGSVYARTCPEKVDTYIAAAQVTSLEETDMYSYRDALSKARQNGENTSELENAYTQYESDKSLMNLMNLRNKIYPYHPVEIGDKATWMAVVSPYFGVDDLRWFFIQLGNFEEYVKLNQQLFDFTFDFNIYDYGLDYEMPAYFISGSCDWVCPVEPIREYAESVQAPSSDFLVINGPGHNLQYSTPKEFAEAVKRSTSFRVRH